MMPDQIDYRAVRRRAEKTLQEDKRNLRILFFFINLLMFFIFMFFGWGMFLSAGGAAANPSYTAGQNPLVAAMIMLSAGWTVALVFQFISAAIDTENGGKRMRERAFGRELARELEHLGMEEDDDPKLKQKRIMRLSDDGELEAIDDADDDIFVDERDIAGDNERKVRLS